MKILHQYWLLPILSALIWWTMLATLLGLWASAGYPATTKPGQYIPYISDIGAGRFQPVFVTGSAAQGALFVLSLATEFHLRRTGRLRQHLHLWPMRCLMLSIAFAVVGQLGIIFVAIFDTLSYHEVHVSLLVVYIVFIGISALFNVVSSAVLEHSHINELHIRISLWFKVAWFIIEFLFAIGFVTLQSFYTNAPAVLEWIISFLYPFYQLSIAWDLWPAVGKLRGYYTEDNQKYPKGRCTTFNKDAVITTWLPAEPDNNATQYHSAEQKRVHDSLESVLE